MLDYLLKIILRFFGFLTKNKNAANPDSFDFEDIRSYFIKNNFTNDIISLDYIKVFFSAQLDLPENPADLIVFSLLFNYCMSHNKNESYSFDDDFLLKILERWDELIKSNKVEDKYRDIATNYFLSVIKIVEIKKHIIKNVDTYVNFCFAISEEVKVYAYFKLIDKLDSFNYYLVNFVEDYLNKDYLDIKDCRKDYVDFLHKEEKSFQERLNKYIFIDYCFKQNITFLLGDAKKYLNEFLFYDLKSFQAFIEKNPIPEIEKEKLFILLDSLSKYISQNNTNRETLTKTLNIEDSIVEEVHLPKYSLDM